MVEKQTVADNRGRWMALTAALLGWMFDGLEMGLFPLIGRPAINALLGPSAKEEFGLWFSAAIAGFLVGAATGGVLFGWLGDRIGRVRAMMLSVFTYAIFTGLCGVATHPWHIAVLRFLSALGMGGEWSLGVALVMEIWPERSRVLLAGLVGTAANIGFLLIAVIGLGLTTFLTEVGSWLAYLLPASWVDALVADSGWRLLFFIGATPALLTFFIRLFVPESERWLHEQEKGATSYWATRDLLGVLIGAAGAGAIVYVWIDKDAELAIRIPVTLIGLLVCLAGYTFPVIRYMQRAGIDIGDPVHGLRPTLTRMMLAACLGAVALTATWGANQWNPAWADDLVKNLGPEYRNARNYTQICSATGAVFGTFAGAMLGTWLSRRVTYALLCFLALGSSLCLYQLYASYDAGFLFMVFVAGATTSSFYGWMPLYLPELFRTRVRATGQGFGFNFGRILAAIGVLQTGNLMSDVFHNDYPKALTVITMVYFVGLALIWVAPETRGQPLPE